MIFELGKTYVFTDGKLMKIVGVVDSVAYGKCLIGETDHGDFIPVGDTDEHTINWKKTEKQLFENLYRVIDDDSDWDGE